MLHLLFRACIPHNSGAHPRKWMHWTSRQFTAKGFGWAEATPWTVVSALVTPTVFDKSTPKEALFCQDMRRLTRVAKACAEEKWVQMTGARTRTRYIYIYTSEKGIYIYIVEPQCVIESHTTAFFQHFSD